MPKVVSAEDAKLQEGAQVLGLSPTAFGNQTISVATCFKQ